MEKLGEFFHKVQKHFCNFFFFNEKVFNFSSFLKESRPWHLERKAFPFQFEEF